MTILALKPTQLRSVAAGLVVGNPVGSSGTRAKALTAAELKAIVEASGISYLPLSGGTLTGALTATGITTRNGLTATTAEVHGTYTSATSREFTCIKPTSTAHQIGSAIGSAGGTNRAVQLGHFDAAGTFTSGLSVATNGEVTIPSNLRFNGTLFRSDSSTGLSATTASALTLQISGTQVFGTGNVNEVTVRQAALLGFSSSASNVTSSPDAGIRRNSTGPAVVVVANGGLQVRNLANSADASLTCSDVTFTPSASRTLSTNSTFAIEMTSNTAGNLVYRGSDGTTRRMALTFS